MSISGEHSFPARTQQPVVSRAGLLRVAAVGAVGVASAAMLGGRADAAPDTTRAMGVATGPSAVRRDGELDAIDFAASGLSGGTVFWTGDETYRYGVNVSGFDGAIIANCLNPDASYGSSPAIQAASGSGDGNIRHEHERLRGERE